MTTYLYCLLSASAEHVPAPALSGVQGAFVRVLIAGPVVAWVSDSPGSPVRDAGNARAHNAVVRAALELQTPLPARFGQTFSTDEALRREIDRRREQLSNSLARLEGSVEMTVRAPLPDPEPGTDGDRTAVALGPGRSYLERLRRAEQREERARGQASFLQTALSAKLGDQWRQASAVQILSAVEYWSVSHLIARDAVARFREEARGALAEVGGTPALLSGPWAPYSFAGALDG